MYYICILQIQLYCYFVLLFKLWSENIRLIVIIIFIYFYSIDNTDFNSEKKRNLYIILWERKTVNKKS